MSFCVEALDETGYKKLSQARATELCAAALSALGHDPETLGEISIAVVEVEIIRNLNLKFRKSDKPTDVLSFEIDGVGGEMVGEIVVAPGYVGFDVGEVEELVVHGALHLGGLDHGEDFEASEMARVQREVLGSVRGGG